MELTKIQKELLYTQCPICNEDELGAMDSVGDEEPFLWCANCETTVNGAGTVERGYVTEYIYDASVCPSSLNEWGKPMTEETAHVWDERESPVTCAECGATR